MDKLLYITQVPKFINLYDKLNLKEIDSLLNNKRITTEQFNQFKKFIDNIDNKHIKVTEFVNKELSEIGNVEDLYDDGIELIQFLKKLAEILNTAKNTYKNTFNVIFDELTLIENEFMKKENLAIDLMEFEDYVCKHNNNITSTLLSKIYETNTDLEDDLDSLYVTMKLYSNVMFNALDLYNNAILFEEKIKSMIRKNRN